jgi:hypothetical protein
MLDNISVDLVDETQNYSVKKNDSNVKRWGTNSLS